MPKVSEEHRARRRDQILTAAMRCAAREGFHKTTMSAVIRESGLSAGAVYLYFSSKQELIRAVAGTAVGAVAGTLGALTEPENVVPPEQALLATTSRILEVGRAHDVEIIRVALQAWAEAARDPAVLALLHEEIAGIRAAWTDYAVAAIAAGHLAADADPVAVARTLMSMLPGFMLLRLVDPSTDPEQYAAGLAALRRPASPR
ncbi:TetR/AcrR family transcriptional regulator [Nocardioides insulae]|uniref:TetR/AcrR family transcriptional regulator n=1 Tax=Nocardioides insulae TaxID=394734 RepID=UPI000409D3B6|nr:TetR/AcrR family transcriptional regulator [Nocardioides insulae]